MRTGRISCRAHSCNGLSLFHLLSLACKKLGAVHVNGADAAAMVDHDVVPHGIAVGGCHHLTVVAATMEAPVLAEISIPW